jgi:predicted RNA binding protein YcfA (HicA-like mRNA interferase family)
LSRLHPARAREVIRFLESLGFVQMRQKGNHKFFRHKDGRTATVPDHKREELGRGILAKILRDAGVKTSEFLAWLS